MREPAFRLGYADTPLGQLHYAEGGEGLPVILLHQTPRSWDEFRELLPILAAGHRVIAMDMYGFGLSAKPAAGAEQTIEQYAGGVLALAEALGLDEFALVGHHTGMFVATEVAAAAPDKVKALVLSGAEYADEEYRRNVARDLAGAGMEHGAGGHVDVAPTQADGSHLTVLWAKRRPLYPVGNPNLLNRFIRDALAPGVDPACGHQACGRYRMEDRVSLVTAPILLLANTHDPVSYPHTARVSEAFGNARSVDVVDIPGGTVAVMEDKAEEVAAVIEEFLDKTGA